MKKISLIVGLSVSLCVLLILLLPGNKNEPGPGSYWTADLLLLKFGLGDVGPTAPWQSTTIAQVFQNPAGIVRHELRSTFPPAHVVREAREIHIFDYSHGIFMGFNKGEPRAAKIKLPDVDKNPFLPKSEPLAEMEIQGHRCKGVENRLHDLKNRLIEWRQTWKAVDLDFKQPLLEIVQTSRDNGTLILITVRSISNLKQVNTLDPTLFQVPAGTQFMIENPPLPSLGNW